MTVLMWLLCIAFLAESYFFYVPASVGGGVLGAGPIVTGLGSPLQYLIGSLSMTGAALSGKSTTVGDIRSINLLK